MTEDSGQQVGYRRPPPSTRFAKGQSGNPRGRPRGKKREVPYDHVLGQMVTIREEGRERRVTAAEAFLLQLTKKGLEGCSASARASLASIEQARASKARRVLDTTPTQVVIRIFGLCVIVEDLGMAVRLHATDEDKVRLELKPWIVQAAIDRMKPNQLSPAEQAIVVAATRTPAKVSWPDWWSIRG